jgi:hypothetical protein
VCVCVERKHRMICSSWVPSLFPRVRNPAHRKKEGNAPLPPPEEAEVFVSVEERWREDQEERKVYL